jgi:hypothetical protein
MKIFPRFKSVRFLKIRKGLSHYILDVQNYEGGALHATCQVTIGRII